jgi:hypothetical protein
VLRAAIATKAQVILLNIVCLLQLAGRTFTLLFVEESSREVRARAVHDPRNDHFVTGITARKKSVDPSASLTVPPPAT